MPDLYPSPPRRRTDRRPLIGPHNHGRRFRWERYIAALDEGDYEPDCRFELSRGILIVENMSMAEAANPWHFYVVDRVRELFSAWRRDNPGRIEVVGGGGENRLVIPISESDRHPDLAVYTVRPPSNDRRAWWNWPPALAVEVVSPGSSVRDHEEKPPEYLAYGVGEYWIFDPDHPDRPGPSARVFTRVNTADGDVWQDRWEDETVTSERFPGLTIPVADVLAPLPEPAADASPATPPPGEV